MTDTTASNFATGGNVEQTKFARSFKKYRPLVFVIAGVAFAAVFLFCLTQGIAGLEALQSVHPGVTSTTTSLTLKAVAYPSSSALSNGTMMLGLAITLLTFPIVMAIMFRSRFAKFRAAPSLLGFLSAAPFIIITLFIPSPNHGLITKVNNWGERELHISDLSQYVPVKMGAAQGFTVTNDKGEKITFEIKTVPGDSYDITSYRLLKQ
jgi:hypothetical protein